MNIFTLAMGYLTTCMRLLSRVTYNKCTETTLEDQSRAKRRANIGLKFVRRADARLQTNADVAA